MNVGHTFATQNHGHKGFPEQTEKEQSKTFKVKEFKVKER